MGKQDPGAVATCQRQLTLDTRIRKRVKRRTASAARILRYKSEKQRLFEPTKRLAASRDAVIANHPVGNERLDPAVDHVMACGVQRLDQRGYAAVDQILPGSPHDEVGARPPLAKKGVAADLAPLMRALGFAQQVGDLAFRDPAPICATAMDCRPPACQSALSSIPAVICGTPAMMKTLPCRMPGAPDMRFSISSAPLGTRAIRSRASVSPPRVS
jgi:hypothetical protein